MWDFMQKSGRLDPTQSHPAGLQVIEGICTDPHRALASRAFVSPVR